MSSESFQRALRTVADDIRSLLSDLTDLVINDGDSENLLVLLTTASILEERLEQKTDLWNKDALAAIHIKSLVVDQIQILSVLASLPMSDTARI